MGSRRIRIKINNIKNTIKKKSKRSYGNWAAAWKSLDWELMIVCGNYLQKLEGFERGEWRRNGK